MIKQALAQGDIPYLIKLFDTYLILNDEKEILKVGGKLIQKADKLNNKDKLIGVFDKIYEIISKHRKTLRDIIDMENSELKNENKRKVKYLKEYKMYFSSTLQEFIRKITKDINKGLSNVTGHNVTQLFNN